MNLHSLPREEGFNGERQVDDTGQERIIMADDLVGRWESLTEALIGYGVPPQRLVDIILDIGGWAE